MKRINKEEMKRHVMIEYNKIQPFIMRLSKDNGFYASFVYNMRFNDNVIHQKLIDGVFNYVFDFLVEKRGDFFNIRDFNTDNLELFLVDDVLRDERLMTFALIMKLMEYTNLTLDLYNEVMKCVYEKMFSGMFVKIKYKYKSRVAFGKFSN